MRRQREPQQLPLIGKLNAPILARSRNIGVAKGSLRVGRAPGSNRLLLRYPIWRKLAILGAGTQGKSGRDDRYAVIGVLDLHPNIAAQTDVAG